jgi:hypothetical protein
VVRSLDFSEPEAIKQRWERGGLTINALAKATGHGWNTIEKAISDAYDRMVVRHCTRLIKCPSCGRSHKHRIKVQLYRGQDLLDA